LNWLRRGVSLTYLHALLVHIITVLSKANLVIENLF
jgi:hypothetical protein